MSDYQQYLAGNDGVFQVVRRIELDAGHRVTDHASKCKNVHGHRYVVEARLEGRLVSTGEERGMVKDFGHIKDTMMTVIHKPCDHHLLLWVEDPVLRQLLEPMPGTIGWNDMRAEVDTAGSALREWSGGQIYVMDCVPTAENLARHWGIRLAMAFSLENKPEPRESPVLRGLTVWETPNCSAEWFNF